MRRNGVKLFRVYYVEIILRRVRVKISSYVFALAAALHTR